MTKKDTIIRLILHNPVYTPESALRKNVHAGLLKLNETQLTNLKLIIELEIAKYYKLNTRSH